MNVPLVRRVRTLGIFASCFLVVPSFSAAIVACNDAELRAAIASGGSVTIGCSGILSLTNQIVITTNTALDGTPANVTVDGANAHRLFVVNPGVQFTIRGLTLANGRSASGGALLNDRGTVTIINCVFTNNLATGIAGTDGTNGTNAPPDTLGSDPARGGDGANGEPGQSAQGGAIANFGLLNVTNTLFVGNAVLAGNGGNGGSGGGVYSDFFSASQAGSGGQGAAGGNATGGALHSSGIAAIVDSRFNGQLCLSGAGGGGGNQGDALYSTTQPTAHAGLGAPGGRSAGGAIFSLGDLLVSNCVFTSNLSRAGVGGHGGGRASATIVGGIPASNGTNAADGGMALGGAMFLCKGSVLDTIVASNACVGGTGGDGGSGGSEALLSRGGRGGDGGIGGNACGGALVITGDVSLVECELSGNRSEGGCGGKNGVGGWRNGPPGIAGKGGDSEGGAVWVQAGTLRIVQSIVTENHVLGGAGGGGIYNLNVAKNNCGRGGVASGAGLANHGQLIISSSAVQQNAAVGGIGGAPETAKDWFYPTLIANGSLGGDAFGAGVFNVGTLVIDRSLVASNSALGGKGGDGRQAKDVKYQSGGDGYFGGSGFGGGLFSAAIGMITNSTFFRNTAMGGMGGNGGSAGWLPIYECFGLQGGSGGGGGSAFGGAMLMNSPSNFLKHVTVAYNAALAGDGGTWAPGYTNCEGISRDGVNGSDGGSFGGGIYAGGGGISVEHVLFAYNTGGNILASSLNDIGVNLNSDATYTFGSGLNNIDPLLGLPASHGGPTKTMPLLSGSPAIDKISPTTGSLVDQRGAARPVGVASDIGAYEADRTLYLVHGRVSAGGAAAAGISLNTSNLTAITDAQGYYRLGGLLLGAYTVTPLLANAMFNPPARTVVVESNVFGADFSIVNVSIRGRIEAGNIGNCWFEGLPGREYVVEASATLTNWTIVVTNTASPDGRIPVMDIATNQVPYRFYRARPL